MRIHIITVGEPKLDYAKQGWLEYLSRLKHYHRVKITHLANKKAYDPQAIMTAAVNTYRVVLEINGARLSSTGLAQFLEKRSHDGKEVSFIIGGPEGLPEAVRDAADFQWSLSELTLPHDLAMVVLLEALYRASTISASHPYHK